MDRNEAMKLLSEIKHYLTAGNPVWDVDEIAEACDMAIETLKNEINCVKCEHYTERETYTGIKGVCKMDTAHREDLIRRSDALKPFCIAPDGTRIPEVDCDNFPVEFSVEFIKKHLLSLPSEKPKTKCIAQIRIDRDDMEDLINNKVNEIVEKLSESKTGWIPVSEELPSEGQVVLAIGDKGTWGVGKFQGTAGWTDDERMWNWKKKTVKYVEYWMPKDAIPLPNREDGEE